MRPTGERGGHERLYATLAGVAALALLALVVWLSGPRRTWDIIERLAPWEALVLVATSFGVSAFTALAWRVVLRTYGHTVSVWLLFRLTIVAFATGWLIPSGFVAGVPVAALLLRRRGVPLSQGMASFGIGRFLEITAYAAILPLALFGTVGGHGSVRILVAGVLAGVILVYLDLFLGWQLARRTIAAIRAATPRATHRALDAASGLCRDVAGFFGSPARAIVAATAYSFAAIGMALVRALLASRFLALRLTTPEVVVMFAITVFLMAIPLLPGAVGAFEGGIAGAFELIGRSKSDGVAYAVTVHAAELTVVIAGLVVLAHVGAGLFRAPTPARPHRRRRLPVFRRRPSTG
jgi:uncharacterized protein (TIRG00374 family)